MTFSVKNTSATNDVNVGRITIGAGATRDVDFVTQAMLDAQTAGYVEITPNPAIASESAPTVAAAVVVLTDNSTGVSGGNTIAAVSDVATAANAIATLAAKLNAVIAAVNTNGTALAGVDGTTGLLNVSGVANEALDTAQAR